MDGPLAPAPFKAFFHPPVCHVVPRGRHQMRAEIFQQRRDQRVGNVPPVTKAFAEQLVGPARRGLAVIHIAGVKAKLSPSPRSLTTQRNLKPKNQPREVLPRCARSTNAGGAATRWFSQAALAVEAMNEIPARSPPQWGASATNAGKPVGLHSTNR
jgi:hypothetical protein